MYTIKRLMVIEVWGREKWIGGAQVIFREGNCSVCCCNSRFCHYLSKPTECTTQRVNSNVNYGLWFIRMYQYWLINCFNKCTTLMQVVNNRGNWGREAGERAEVSIYRTGTLSFLHSFSVNLKLLKK